MTYRRSHPSVAVAGLLSAPLAVVLAAGPLGAGPAVASATPRGADATWAADLSTIDGDDVNVTYRDGALRLADLAGPPTGQRSAAVVTGVLVLAGHPLAEPARQVRADLVADAGRGAVEVEVRGVGTTGWSEWHRMPAGGTTFDHPVSTVQVRVRLAVPTTADRAAGGDGDAPRVSAVTLTAVPAG